MLNTKTRRLVLGLILLLVVDVIWVLSSELTKFLYENERYDKPFFCTYFKTSLFTVYLLVMGLLSPWKDTCERNNSSYTLVDQASPSAAGGGPENGGIVSGNSTANGDADDGAASLYSATTNSLSDSTFIPIKPDDGGTNGVGSGSGSETSDDVASIKSVRFNRLAEVREMSAHEAGEALLARLSYAASIRLRRQKSHHKTARTALLFCMLWFLGNYLFQLALETDETALVTLLSSTSSLFTLLLAAAFPSATGDRLTLSKAVAVLVSCGGVVLVTISDVNEAHMSRGIVLALLSALFYAAYLVLVKHKSAVEERINIPLFFGFVGLWNMLLLWPVLFVLHFTQIEVFVWPDQTQLLILLLNGLVGTVLSEALWLWACFLTSSIIGTIAFTLQIPLSILIDVLLKGRSFSPLFYAGAVPMCMSLVAVALLLRHDDGDPLLRFCKIVYRKVCHCRQPGVVRILDLDDEQQESLIDSYEH